MTHARHEFSVYFVLRCEAAKNFLVKQPMCSLINEPANNFLVKQRRTTEDYKVKSYHKQNYDES